jgi:AraC-like DNA-binding protein
MNASKPQQQRKGESRRQPQKPQSQRQTPPPSSSPKTAAATTPEDAPPDARMTDAMAFLRREFRRRPDLSQIARAAHLSPYHFHRTFRRHFGKTPKQVIAELQIAEVQRLILAGTPLGVAAKRVGFTQHSHLTARFKKATGLTPTAWLLLTRAREAGNTSPS